MQQQDYGPFPYSAITRRPKWKWPNGAKLALWACPNLEWFSLKTPLAGQVWEKHSEAHTPGVRQWGQRDYGNRVVLVLLWPTNSQPSLTASSMISG